MRCTNCGNELESDALFCTVCGAKVETQIAQVMPKKAQEEPVKERNVLVTGILGIAVIALAVVAVFLVKNIFIGEKNYNDKQLVYMKDEEIYFVKNMEKENEPVLVDEVRTKDDAVTGAGQIFLTDKYLYYFNRVDGMGYGTLSRAELGKLSSNSGNNKKYITEIADDVTVYRLFSDVERLAYSDDSGNLFYYNGSEEIKIDRDVELYRISENEKYILYHQKDKDDSIRLCCYGIEEDDTMELADDIEGSVLYGMGFAENGDFTVCEDFVVYTQNSWEENPGMNLFITGIDRKTEAIGEDVTYIAGFSREKQMVYYLQARTKKGKVYDFIEDPYAQSDAAIVEPVKKSYLIPVTEQEVILETEYSDDPEWREYFYDDVYYDGYYDDEVGMYGYTVEKEDDYGNDEDEYITYYWDNGLHKWYRFDTASYNEDMAAFEQVRARKALRETLQNEDYEYTYYDLYAWQEEEGEKLLAENVLPGGIYADVSKELVVFQKQQEKQRVSIEDAGSMGIEQLEEMEYAPTGDSYYVYKGEEKELDVKGEPAEIFCSKDGKYVMVRSDEYTDKGIVNRLSCFNLGTDMELTWEEDGNGILACGWQEDGFYYFDDIEDSYGDLYLYQTDSKEPERVLRDIYAADCRKYEDGNILAFQDYDYTYGGRLIRLDKKGKEEKIENDITEYTYFSPERILYVSDEDLYIYSNKESRRIERNVQTYCCYGAEYKSIY